MAKAVEVCNVMRTVGVFDAQVVWEPLDLLVSNGAVLAEGISHGAGSSRGTDVWVPVEQPLSPGLEHRCSWIDCSSKVQHAGYFSLAVPSISEVQPCMEKPQSWGLKCRLLYSDCGSGVQGTNQPIVTVALVIEMQVRTKQPQSRGLNICVLEQPCCWGLKCGCMGVQPGLRDYGSDRPGPRMVQQWLPLVRVHSIFLSSASTAATSVVYFGGKSCQCSLWSRLWGLHRCHFRFLHSESCGESMAIVGPVEVLRGPSIEQATGDHDDTLHVVEVNPHPSLFLVVSIHIS